MKPISIISQALFDKVRSRFSNLEMGDETGAVVIDPEEARFFDFDFVFEGNNLGRVSISINDPGSLKVYFSQGITENQDDPAKKEWFNFLREMRFFSMRRLLRFDTRDIAKTNLDKKDFQHLAKTQAPKEETDMTTMNENKKNKTGVAEAGYGRNRGYNPGFADPHAPKLGGREYYGQGAADDESNLLYIYKDGRLKQKMVHNRNERQARAEGFRDTQDQALKVHGIIRSKFDPKKFVQNQGGKWVQVFPYGEDQGEAEGLQEGRWNHKSSKKTSRAVAGKTEVIVRHSKPVDEEYAGSRSQKKNIKAIYIQNADGERFKYPFIHTAGAFAMAQHVDHGGVPHDPAGQAIVRMSEEIAKLGEFQRKIHRATLHQDASGITERAMSRMNELKSQIESLGKRHHYQNWMETFNSDSMMDPSMEELDDVTMEQYKQKFTQTNFQEELSAYFPLLHKIMSETNKINLADYVGEELEDDSDADTEAFDIGMGQASYGKGHPDEQFAEWAEAVEQGKLTTDQIEELKQAISELPQGNNGPELDLGPGGSTAIEFFQGSGLDDDDLKEKLKDMANVNSESDALEVFKIWSNENYPELAVALGISDTDTGAEEPAPEAPVAPEQPTAENGEMAMHKGAMSTRESVVKEVAKLVKSRYNKDNPEVGPFNGKENIALDVKKKCAEMFGDEVGEQAEGLAMQFMEKLSSEWEAKHGPVQDDGLARLKELLDNVKAKVEGIGDITVNGHAPGNNIMPAEEGILDKAKEFGKKILDKVAPGDDELLKRLEKDTGGKRPNMYNKPEQKEAHVNELSKGTLKSYSKAAAHDVYTDQRDAETARDRAYHADQHGEKSNSLNWADEADWLDNRAEKRAGGIVRATTKIAQKEDTEFESIMKLAGISEGDGPKKVSKKEIEKFQKKDDAKFTGREVNRQEQDKNKKK